MKHPYIAYKNSQYWSIINKAIDDLVNNEDIEEKTTRDHIVGYICKLLVENDPIKNSI
jgi:hypothetical protein